MSDYLRFVTYMNLYEENRKVKNVGFAKIEQKEGQCRIEIHMKGIGYTGMHCQIYLFSQEGKYLKCAAVGSVQLINGNADRRILLQSNNVGGSGICFEKMRGLVLFVNEKIMVASQWKEGELLRECFVLPGEEVKDSEREEVEKMPSKPELRAAEVATMHQSSEMSWPDTFRMMMELFPVLTPFEGEEEICCIRIELKDLRMLPKRYWYLGNNSFLLHGFFNYRYLILGVMEQEDVKRWFLGVPGVYYNQEKMMALLFGFGEFKCEKKAECNMGQFGYWYRFMDE